MKRVLIATNNKNKAAEIRAVMDLADWEFVTLGEAGIESDPAEDADSFEGNALIKAKSAFELSGVCSMADDSGLEVDALDGAPGVYSARYSGANATDLTNNALLLANLEGVPEDERTARFVCCIAFVDADGEPLIARGTVEGKIGFRPQGEDGFGYDPLFFPDELGGDVSFAQIPQSEKNEISHRGRALAQLKRQIMEKYGLTQN